MNKKVNFNPIALFQSSRQFISTSFISKRWLPLSLCILLPLLSFCVGCSSQTSNIQEPELLVALSFAPRHLMIDNQNDFVWTKVTIKLNDNYIYQTNMLSRGPSSIPLSSFHNELGEAFNPEKTQPHHLILEVLEGFNGNPGQFIW
ncbi:MULTISPECIES: hypothetical protein [unclassified Paenibacillus]|uniref:hypothetical protein n=1 Tax=unclassified Paenibacillus TaxID=185978 RepID=UPI00364016CE